MGASVCLSPVSGGFGVVLTPLWFGALPDLPLPDGAPGEFLSGSLVCPGV